jgi:hypothetical protein
MKRGALFLQFFAVGKQYEAFVLALVFPGVDERFSR